MTTRRRTRIGVTGIVCLLLTFPLRAEPNLVDRVQVAFVSISSVDTAGVDLRFGVSGVARTTVTLTQVVIDDLTVGGIHLAARTVSGPLTLKHDQAIRGLDNLSVRVSYSDLPSLTPLRDIVRDGHTRLRATIRGKPSLSFLERIVLMGRETIAIAHLDQDVAVTVPGGLPGVLALESALALGGPVWDIGRRVTSIAMSDGAPVDEPGFGTIALATHYRLRTGDGVVRPVTRTTAGILLDDRTVLATAESVEPWMFDPAEARGLRDRSLWLEDGSVQIRLAPGTGRCGSDPQSVQIAKTLHERVQAFADPTGPPFVFRLRDTASNAALLELRHGSWRAAPRASLQERAGWHPVTIPRACGPDALRTSIRWDGHRYQIRDRVDRDQFGAPIVSDRGIVGMVQDERSGVRLSDVLPTLGWQAHR